MDVSRLETWGYAPMENDVFFPKVEISLSLSNLKKCSKGWFTIRSNTCCVGG